MNFLLIVPHKYDLTDVMLFIQSLPPEGRLEVFGPPDSTQASFKVAEVMGLAYKEAPSAPDPSHYSFCRSLEWETDNVRNQKYAKLTEVFADEGILLRSKFPSRFNRRKSFVYCTACNTLLPEDKHIDLLKHCANCCSDRKYLISLTSSGVALVKLYEAVGYHSLTPGGRKAWPYNESKEDYLFASAKEWRDHNEGYRKSRRKGEAEAARTPFRLRSTWWA
jgi:hypothetical protein